MQNHRSSSLLVAGAVLAALVLGACQSRPGKRRLEVGESAGSGMAGDPTQREVPLPSESEGWDAFLVYDNGETGIWTVKSFQVFPQYACPELVALDDKGRCFVLVSYSGKWTPMPRIYDGKWLGGLTYGDVDPRAPGSEVYTGSQSGNLYQLRSYDHGALDARLIAHFQGLEVHTIVAGEFDDSGRSLLVFTRPGNLFHLTPSGQGGSFEIRHLQELPGRVRDAELIPNPGGRPDEVLTVARSGALALLRLGPGGPEWYELYRDQMGMGRMSLHPDPPPGTIVAYSTHDDGRILRHETRDADRLQPWRTETIYLADQGPRGVAAGRFDPDPDKETVAIFGYNAEVQLLTQGPGGWSAETLFIDRDKGHWLAAAELDGRNETDELVLSGYGGRVVLLARPRVGATKAR